MKKYQSRGLTDQIPQEAQNILMDRQQERERKAFEQMQREENEAPKKAVKDTYQRLRKMIGLDKEPAKKAKGGSVKMAKGGSVSKRGDGIAKKGRTKGRFV
jgi:hypothetical protein